MSDIIVEKRLINLNSTNSTNKYNGTFLSNVDFNFTNILADDKDIVNVQGGVLDATLPISYYTINYANNLLVYDISGATNLLTISVGNYNFNTLKTELEAKFLSLSHIFTVTINKNTGVLTFVYTSTGGGQFNGFLKTGSTCFKVLGFDPNTDYPSTGSTTLTAPYLLNLLGFKKIKICSLVFNTGSYDSSVLSSSNLICSIPVNASSYGLLIYNNVDTTYGNLTNFRNISTIDIQLYNEDGVFINFNNTDWTITLCLLVYRKYKTDIVQPLMLETLRQIDVDIQNLGQQQQDTTDITDTTDTTDTSNLNQNENTNVELGTGDASILEEQPKIEPIPFEGYLGNTENDNDMEILNY